MTHPSPEAEPASDREIVLTRVFDAPRELLWQVWTDPEHVVRWWGPGGFTTTTQHMEVKPGGVWRFTMHGPDGRDYANRITYLEVNAPARLVYRHGGDQECEPVHFTVVVTFDVEGDGRQTRVTMRSVFPSANARDFVVRQYNAIEGGKQHLVRLGEYAQQAAQSQATGDAPFEIARVVAAPRDLVWRVWTQREHLLQWFGPKGMPMTQATLQLRPGGLFHYALRTPDGGVLWARWVFHEITPPERLVFALSFSDEHGGITPPPFPQDWPREMLTVVTLVPHAGVDGGTLVTVRSQAIHATPAQRQTFRDNHGSMQQGWSGTFAQLVEHVAQAQR